MGELVDEAVVHEQPAPVAERVAVRLLHGSPGRGSHVREEQRRADLGRELAQVRVAPGGRDAPVGARLLAAVAVPAEPEAVEVRQGSLKTRVAALLDQRVRRVEEQLLYGNRVPEISEPATHRLWPPGVTRAATGEGGSSRRGRGGAPHRSRRTGR